MNCKVAYPTLNGDFLSENEINIKLSMSTDGYNT